MRITIDDKYIRQMMDKTDLSGVTLASEALGLLKWAISEVEKGKKIVSVDENTQLEKGTEVYLQSLEAVKAEKVS